MTMNEPVMDGANDDMSDGGTSKTEAQDLMEAGKGDEIRPPDSAAVPGLEEDPLANAKHDDDSDHTGV